MPEPISVIFCLLMIFAIGFILGVFLGIRMLLKADTEMNPCPPDEPDPEIFVKRGKRMEKFKLSRRAPDGN